MSDSNVSKQYMYIRWFLLRLGLVLFDIFAVNAAYFLALVVRFYVNFEFNVWAVKYVPAFFEFAPVYTVCCLIVFALLGLYNSLWKYAGVNDMNRILLSSVITCVIQIVGTLMFVMRMPITYYAIGAAFQFAMITVSRFSYRLLVIEREKIFKRKNRDSINVMVVGVGESSRTVIKHLERDAESVAHPVCVVDFSNSEYYGTMAGVPVIGGIDKVKDAVKRYQVDRVMLADSIMPSEIRRSVREICKEIDITVQDFSGYFQSVPSRIPLKALLEYVEGPVEVEIDGHTSHYPTAERAVQEVTGKYILASVCAHEGILHVRLIQDVLQPNDIQADWVQTYEKETGEDISFF